jgi:ketosteroid isomerase-like protein
LLGIPVTAPAQATGLRIEISQQGGFMKGNTIVSTLAVFAVLMLANLGWAQGTTSFAMVGITAVAGTTDEQAIRDMDAEWSRAAENKDATKFASFYSETGSAMPFNAPIATGRAKAQELWAQLMAKPGFSLRFAPTQVEVAKSKDMAYDIGTFELKLNDAQGSPMTIPGKYVVIWKKQKGGDWKAEADIFNTDK